MIDTDASGQMRVSKALFQDKMQVQAAYRCARRSLAACRSGVSNPSVNQAYRSLSCHVCERERLFERSDIEVACRDGVPVQHVRVGREEVLHSRKCLAQLVEQLAQVIARLSLGGVGPEEEGKMLGLLRNIAMQLR